MQTCTGEVLAGLWGIRLTHNKHDYFEQSNLYSKGGTEEGSTRTHLYSKAGTEERSTFSKIYAMLRLRELSSLTPPASSKSKLLLLYGCMGGERVGCVCGCVRMCVYVDGCVCLCVSGCVH